MNNLYLNVPFIVMSTKVDGVRETEKRFLTPFGTIDVTFRTVSNVVSGASCLEIDVQGDTKNWLYCASAITEFKTALVHFVCWITQEHLQEGAYGDFDELRICIKGAEIDQTVRCADSCGI